MKKLITLFLFPIFTFSQYTYNLHGWIYPGNYGEPGCLAINEINDGRFINGIRVELLRINNDGLLEQIKNFECNDANSNELSFFKSFNGKKIITISGNIENFRLTLHDSIKFFTFLKNSLDYTIDTFNFDGIEINVEQFYKWTTQDWNKFKLLIQYLGDSLDFYNKTLGIIGPALISDGSKWKYEELNNLPIHQLTVMFYDYFYEDTVGSSVAPLNWINQSINYILSKFNDYSKLFAGINSYGYYSYPFIGYDSNGYPIYDFDTYGSPIRQKILLRNLSNFTNAIRRMDSYEFFFNQNNILYNFSDALSISKKINLLLEKGIRNFSIWHLGGNDWVDDTVFNNYKFPDNSNCINVFNCENSLNLNRQHTLFIDTTSEIKFQFNLNNSTTKLLDSLHIILCGHRPFNSDTSMVEISISLDGGENYSLPVIKKIFLPFDIQYEIISPFKMWGLTIDSSINSLFIKIKTIKNSLNLNSIFILDLYKEICNDVSYDTITIQVFGSQNDARNNIFGGLYNHTVFTQYLGNYNGVNYLTGLRFINVPISDSSDIEKVVLDLFYADISSGDSVNIKIFTESTQSPSIFNVSNQPIHRIKSYDSLLFNFKINELPSYTPGFGFLCFDITSLIKNHIVNFNPQNIVLLLYTEANLNNYIGFSTFDRAQNRGAKLYFITKNGQKRSQMFSDNIEKYSLTIDLFPNPASYALNVSSNKFIENMEIYDITGKKIKELRPNEKLFDLDISFLSSGVYYFKFTCEKTVVFKKVIKSLNYE